MAASATPAAERLEAGPAPHACGPGGARRLVTVARGRVQTVLGPDRPGRPRLGPAPRAHRDRALAHPEPLGLLGAPPRRAGDRRGARGVPGGRRRHGRRPDARRRRARSRRGSPGCREATGLNVVMGARLVSRRLLPGRGADRPPLRRLARRRDRPRRDRGRGRDRDPARDHRRDRDGQAVDLAAARSGSTEPPPGPPAGPGSRSRPTRSSRRSGLDQLDVFEAEGADLSRVVIGHADSNPSPDYHLAIVERGAIDRVRLPRDELHAARAPRRGPGRRVDLRPAGARPRRADPAVAGRLPRLASSALRRQRLHLPRRRRSCRGSARPACRTPRSGRSRSTTRGGC